MFKFIAVTLAVLYAVMHTFGDEMRRPEVARAEPMALGLVPAAYAVEAVEEDTAPQRLERSSISEAEAVKLALRAGADYRSERKRAPLRGTVQYAAANGQITSDATISDATAEPAADLWYVTGNTVNLRSGPGTSNPAVTQLNFGREAEVLDSSNGWYQIRTVDGSTTGWIHGNFLADRKPG